MQLSFGMIFSILLIIFFVAIAFYAIKVLLNAQDNLKVSKFKLDLQNEIDKIWKSSKTSQEFGGNNLLPSKVKKVCVVDFSNPAIGDEELYKKLKQSFWENENLFFYPTAGQDAMFIKNLDLEKTTASENPLCFDVLNSKVKFILEKNFGESLVTIR